jgi:D-amino-acid dehydrogenase
MSKVTIIGGGIIGLFTAYYLVEAGAEVTVLDQGDLTQGCSLGNAGMIVPSHFVPLASPGMIGKGVKWMLSAKSPFYIHPRLDRRLVEWCLLFYRSATKKHVDRSLPYLKNLSLLSKSLYFDFAREHPGAGIGLEEKGLLMLYKTAATEHEEVEMAELSNANGIVANVLSRSEVRELEPEADLDVRGAVHFTGDAHLNPARLYDFLKHYLQTRGVRLVGQAEVLRVAHTGQTVTHVVTSQGDFACDQLVVCAGAWSGKVARLLGLKLPMLSGKGYSFMQENQPAIRTPAILTEQKVAVTPFGAQVRFGGTMEITDTDLRINAKRVQGIFEAIPRYYTGFAPTPPAPEAVWSGLRPCSPDGMPYIGPTAKWRNVLFGTGHGMMGISLAPATGLLLAEMLREKELSVLTDAFSPDRYA